MKSAVNFPRMREIFFAKETWQVGGEGRFDGVFHLYKGGRDLSGRFRSDEARVNGLSLPELTGSLRWTPDRFEVTNAQSGFYGGAMRFGYSIAPLGKGQRTRAEFDTTYHNVDLSNFSNTTGWAGIRVAGCFQGAPRSIGRSAASSIGRETAT